MATQGPTMYQKRMALRRSTSNLDSLTKQYQRQMAGVGKEYESAYGSYQEKAGERDAAYRSAVAEYEPKKSEYERLVSSYSGRLTDYQSQLADYEKNPTTKKQLEFRMVSNPYSGYSSNKIRQTYYKGKYYDDRDMDYFVVKDNIKKSDSGYYQEVARAAPAPFAEEAPVAPIAPQAEKTQPFDDAPFQQQKQQVETTYKRELGERKAGRQRAVSRKASRSMLQGS
tara:strand:+ start:2358 stop:3035 length:678 start_codon:yes stop_codon:yes gene_type:complete